MATFLSITREQYNKSLPAMLTTGAPVGHYNNKYHSVDKSV